MHKDTVFKSGHIHRYFRLGLQYLLLGNIIQPRIPKFHSFRGDGLRTSKYFIGGHNLTHNTYLSSHVYSEEMVSGNIKRKLIYPTALANMDCDTYTVTCMGLRRNLWMVIIRLSPEDTQGQRRRNATLRWLGT